MPPMQVPDKIDCVDCGQVAHRLTYPPEEGWAPGDCVAYRCSGCNDRWDLVVEDGEHGSSCELDSRFEEARAVLEHRRRERAG